MPKSTQEAPSGQPVHAEATTGQGKANVQDLARRLLEGRTVVTRGCPAAPLNLWLDLAEAVYPPDHAVLKELRKQLVGT